MGEAILKEWMGWLKEELLALVTDDDTYWRMQEDVIHRNHRLLTMRSPYFDMLNYAYVSTTASAIRRLTEKQNRDKTNVSLRIVLQELEKDPTVFATRVPRHGLLSDLAKIEALEKVIKPYVDRIIAHHDKRGIADNPPEYRNLRQGVAILMPAFFESDLAAGRLVQPFDLKATDGTAYWLAYPEASQGRRKIRAFRDWILGEVKQSPV